MSAPILRFPEFTEQSGKRLELFALAINKGLQTGPFGSQLKAEEYVDDIDGIPVVMPRDISNGVIITDKIARIESSKADEMQRHRLQYGDVIFPRRGELGRIAVVGHEQADWICGTGCQRFRPNFDLVSPTYLGFSFGRERIVYWLESNAVGQTMLNLNTEILSGMPVLVPTLPEQQKIAEFLGAVDARVGLLRRRRDGLRAYKKGMMQRLFSRELRFTKQDGSPFPDWQDMPFSELAVRSSDKFDPMASDEYPMTIELDNLTSGSGKVSGFGALEDQKSLKSRFQEGDVLFGKLRPYLRKYWFADRVGVCSTEIWVLRAKQAIPAFVFYVIQTEQFIQIANQSSGSKMPRADWSLVGNAVFSIPHPEEQQKIADTLTALDAKIDAVTAQMDAMGRFKKGLLQQMFV